MSTDKPVADDALPEPIGYATANGLRMLVQDDATVLLYRYEYLIRPDATAIFTADQMRAAIARERAQADALRTVMIAAAEEIAAHWDAHCDAEGYGPQNLMRRLEEGIPSEYGYTAGRFAELQAELSTLRQQLAEVLRAVDLAVTMLQTGMPEYDSRDVEDVLRAAIAAGAQK